MKWLARDSALPALGLLVTLGLVLIGLSAWTGTSLGRPVRRN